MMAPLRQIYRPKSQLSTASSLLARSIREEEQQLQQQTAAVFAEHIYEEIPETTRQQRLRPLPPIPEGTSLRQEKQKSLTQILHNRF